MPSPTTRSATTTLAALVSAGAVSAQELAQAAIARAVTVSTLGAVAYEAYDHPRFGSGPLAGVPTYVEDNTDVAGMPTNHGSQGYTARPATADGAYTAQFLSTGMTVLGKSRLPEFGLNASTEFMTGPPARRLRVGLILDSVERPRPTLRPAPRSSGRPECWRPPATSSSRWRCRSTSSWPTTSSSTGPCWPSSPPTPAGWCWTAASTSTGWTGRSRR